MIHIIRPLRSGQITIPATVRKELGITDDTLLRLSVTEGELHIKPVHVADSGAGAPFLKELYEYFAPARQEAQEKGYTGEEIDAAVDQAVNAVRNSKQHEA